MVNGNNIILNKETISILAQNYSPLEYRPQLANLLTTIYPTRDFTNYSKYRLHKLANELLFEHYNGEEIFKYKLFEAYVKKKNIIAAFEVKVNNSRLDFLTINGHSTSFEIKSQLDSLDKLEKQMSDYLLAFEYNYLVVDESHIGKVQQLMPRGYGLWSYKDGKYKKQKKAELNNKIDPKVQLELLTKKEQISAFPNTTNLGEIMDIYDPQTINKVFKRVLKLRYKTRWDFVVKNGTKIFPFDVQFFFNTNIEPRTIYT